VFLGIGFFFSFLQDLTLAAVDNPSNAVECGLAEMINQPELIRKAIEELDNVVGTRRFVQESDIPKLDYVKACAREAFRRHPISDFNLAHMSIDDTIVGNYYIPKGSYVVLKRQGLSMNPRIWTEPLEFKPERHLKTNGSNLDFEYPTLNAITFSTRRRGCP
jgi:isoleucine N-monooxygenase